MTDYLNNSFDLNSDKLLEVFDELPFWAAPFGIRLLEYINYKKNITAIDIGFGAGFPLTEIAMRLGKTSKVYGIDPWKAAIKRAEKKIAFYGIGNIEIIQGLAESIPLKDNTVDLIVSNNGINNVMDLEQTLKECFRIAKPKAQFVQTMNLNDTMIEFYDIFAAVLESLSMKESLERMEKQIYSKRKPLEDFTFVVEKSGFKIEQIIKDRFDYEFVDGTTMFNYYFIRLAFLDAWKNIIPLEKQKEVFHKVENKMNEQAEKEGSFKLRVPFVVIDSRKGE